MKKVKDSQKRWKQLVTMLLVAALLVTGTPDVVGFASEGTQEQVTAAAEQSQKNPGEKHRKSQYRKKTAQKEAVQDHEQMSEEAGGQQSSSSHSDTAVKEENTEKERSAAGTNGAF